VTFASQEDLCTVKEKNQGSRNKRKFSTRTGEEKDGEADG